MDDEGIQKLERAVEQQPGRPGDHNSDLRVPGGKAAATATAPEEGRHNTTGNISSHNPGAAKCVFWILGYVAAFAAPAAFLAWLLPSRYAPWIALSAGFFFYAVASFYVGMQWDGPQLTEEGRKFVKQLPFFPLQCDLPKIPAEGRKFVKWLPLIGLLPMVVEVMGVIRNREVTAALVSLAFMAAAIYPPFFLGRFMARRRRGLQAG